MADAIPRALPGLGHLLPAARDPLRFYGALARRSPRAHLRLGPHAICLLSDRTDVEHVLQRDVEGYRKGFGNDVLRPLIGQGLFFAEGDAWRADRRLLMNGLRQERLAALHPLLVTLAEQHLARWPMDQGADLAAQVRRLSLQLTGRGLLRTPRMDPGTDTPDTLNALWGATRAELYLSGPLLSRLPLPAHRRFRRLAGQMQREVRLILSEARAAPPGDGLISALIAAREDEPLLSEVMLEHDALMLLLAGQECTASSITWTLLLLERHPEISRAVDDELARVLGGAAPRFEDLPRLELLRRVLDESLRLYPPTWMMSRQANHEDRLSGEDFGPDSIFFLSPWVQHHHPELWVDPERFDPERFSGRPEKGCYLPFALGPRTCVGMKLALHQALTVLALVRQRLHLDLPNRDEVRPDPGLSLRPDRAIPLCARRR